MGRAPHVSEGTRAIIGINSWIRARWMSWNWYGNHCECQDLQFHYYHPSMSPLHASLHLLVMTPQVHVFKDFPYNWYHSSWENKEEKPNEMKSKPWDLQVLHACHICSVEGRTEVASLQPPLEHETHTHSTQ